MVQIKRLYAGAIIGSALSISACEQFERGRWDNPSEDPSLLVLTPEEPDLIAAAQAANAPHVYLEIQHDGSGPTSIVFGIDHSKDATPSDDPAIRLTPDNGKCNPQVLRYYRFSSAAIAQPVYNQSIALLEGITLAELPNLMAIEVTSEMMSRELIATPTESHPQNVCARKLWTILLATEEFGRNIFPQLSK